MVGLGLSTFVLARRLILENGLERYMFKWYARAVMNISRAMCAVPVGGAAWPAARRRENSDPIRALS